MSPILFHVLPFLLLGLSVCFVDENSLAGYRYPSAMPMVGMVQLAYGYWNAALRISILMAIGITRLSPSLPVLSLLYFLHPAPASALAGQKYLPDGTLCGFCTADSQPQCKDLTSSLRTSCPGDCAAKTPPGFTNPFLVSDGSTRYCESAMCVHFCVVHNSRGDTSGEACCFEGDSEYFDDFYFKGLDSIPDGTGPKSTPDPTPGPAPDPTSGPTPDPTLGPKEGPGIGISCSLVESASAAYKGSLADGTLGTVVSYYEKALRMACLRSSPECAVSECKGQGPPPPEGCESDQDLRGGGFEQDIFEKLIQSSGFGDVSSRQARVNSAIDDLVSMIDAGGVASPFLNMMLRMADGARGQDTRALVSEYYGTGTVQVFDDLQPIFEDYFKNTIGSSKGNSIDELRAMAKDLSRAHSHLLRCGVAPSSDTATTPQTPIAKSATAAFFVPLASTQLRNDLMIRLLEDKARSTSTDDLASILDAKLPVSPSLKPDTRNWIYDALSKGNPNSESASSESMAIGKDELSNELGTKFLISRLYSGLSMGLELIIENRDDKRLSDFMALVGLYFPFGEQAKKPTNITTSGNELPIVGPIGVVFPASANLIPGYNINSSALPPGGGSSGSGKSGSPLTATVPTDDDIGDLLYKTATIRIYINPMHFVDAKPPIPQPYSEHFYLLDLVSGKEIPAKYMVSSQGGSGKPMEFGVLEAEIEGGKGVWAGGWGGGGAFAVGVKGWQENVGGEESKGVRGRRDGGSVWEWEAVGVVAWVVGVVVVSWGLW